MKLYPPDDICEPAPGLKQSRVPGAPNHVFPATMVPARFMVAPLKMPPPSPDAELLTMVEFVNAAVPPALYTAPPLPADTVFPNSVESMTTNVPRLSTAPLPSAALFPLTVGGV